MRCVALAGCVWFALALPCLAADPAAVLQATRAATGGDAWNSLRTLHVRARLQANEQVGVSDRWEDVRTGRFVREFSLPRRTGADGYDGMSVWTQPPGGIAYVLGDEDARLGAIGDSFRIERGWWFAERRPATMEDAGSRTEDTREGTRSFDLVRITPEAGRAFVLWVDRATHLIDRAVEQQAERLSVTRYADYRWVGGLRLPYTIRSGDGDAAFDEVEAVQQVEINPEIADRRYSIPPLPASPSAQAEAAATVPFRLENNRILLQVSINGKGPFEAQFDSGGSLIVPPAVVSELGLAAEGRSKETGGGEGYVTTGHGAVDTLAIGSALLRGPAFHSFAWDDRDPRRVLIGLEVLQHFVVAIDFDHLTMTLTPPALYSDPGSGAVLPFHFQDNQPEVSGSVDGIAGMFAVDTGDDGSLLLIAPFARRYGLAQRYHATLPYGGSSVGATSGLWARAGEVALNGPDGRPLIHVTQPITRISQQQSGFDANRYVSGNLGVGILKQFNLTFDYPHQRILMEPSHFLGLPDVFDRSGMRLKSQGSGWRVETVYPDGAAGRAGIEVGDTLLALDGKERPQLDREALRTLFTAATGTRISVRIRRGSEERTMTITLSDVL
jgi:hypothetical protein